MVVADKLGLLLESAPTNFQTVHVLVAKFRIYEHGREVTSGV